MIKRLLSALVIASLALAGPSLSQIGPAPLNVPLPKAICSIGVPIFLTTTGGTPSTWINTTLCNTFKVEVIGGGGGAGTGVANTSFGSAACGATYAKKNTLALAPGGSFGYSAGAAGVHGANNGVGNAGTTGGDSWFCNSTGNCTSKAGSAVQVAATGGQLGPASSAGCTSNPTTGSVGDVINGGGLGGTFNGGGGGAGGPSGAGGNGANGANCGAGGNGGTADNGSVSGGNGGTTAPTNGSNGNTGTEWDATHGSGSGGGGAGSLVACNSSQANNGGNGGLYGGGGAAGSQGSGAEGTGGDGGQGIVVLTPLSALVPANDNLLVTQVAA